MARLSEAQLDVLGIDLCAEVNMAASEFNAGEADDAETNEMLAGIGELIRGYRRAAALEERNEKLRAAIENWCLVESRHHWATEVDAEEFDECLRCGGVGADLHTVSHRDWCLVARSEALLAEGDE